MHHAVPGRLRVAVADLKGCARTARALERGLCALEGVRSARANPLTGSLVIEHTLGLDALFAGLRALLDRLPELLAGDPAASAREQRAARLGRDPADPPSAAWHTLPAAEVAARLESDPQRGLAPAEARARLLRDGPNRLPPPARRSELAILLGQLGSLPVALLAGSAVVSLVTGGLADAVVILGVVALNATIGWFTESRAERVIAALEAEEPSAVRVRRGGVDQRVPAEDVVRGDLLLLEPGTWIAADGRLVATSGLAVDESALTGESVPVAKEVAALADPRVPLADRRNMVFRGTAVTGGAGAAVVVATGPATEIGRIQSLLGAVTPPPTPLQRQLDELGRRLVLLCGGLCLGIFAVGLARGIAPLAMLKTAVSLAVAALPEGLPAVATTTLALGIGRMRERGVLVRKLAAIETLGAVQTLCLDKTGTLTVNRMTVVAIALGSGPGHHRGRTAADLVSSDRAAATALLEVAAACSEVAVVGRGPEALLDGSPTEAALVRLALEAGLDVAALRAARPRIALEPRTETRPFMVSRHRLADGRIWTAVKGSPLAVLELCTRVREGATSVPLDAERRRKIAALNESMAAEGLRILGFAASEPTADGAAEDELVWLGLLGLADPIRPGTEALVRVFHRAGIRTVMITGDQSATAYAIAKELDLADGEPIEILDAVRLEQLDPELLEALAVRAHVFARVSPSHKLAIVQAMQRAGRVVAMTGDGVNDGPALRAADVGVAMGRGGSEVARQVADIVLADDELSTMAAAIAEGRTTYADIKKAVHYLLATNLSEIAVTGFGAAVGAGAVVSPLQLLWLNLVSDVAPALALALEPPEPDVLARPPRDPRTPFVSNAELIRYGREGLVLAAGTLAAWAWARARHGVGSPVPASVAFHGLTLAQLVHALRCRRERSGPDRRPLARNPWLELALLGSAGLQLSTLLLPPLRRLLGLAPLGVAELAAVVGASLGPFLLEEALDRLPVARGAGAAVEPEGVSER